MNPFTQSIAPGKPGIIPRWTSSAKIGVGTSLGSSNVWFTISHGIINEVYFPRIDVANTRDFGLIVTNGSDFFSEEKRNAVHDYATIADGVPAYILTNTCDKGHYRITKTIITDPSRNVLLQKIKFEPLKGELKDYRLYTLMAPHILNAGYGNTGWACDYKGWPMLFAAKEHMTLAVACSHPFMGMSCGYVGVSDGWQDLYKNKKLTTFYQSADDGNIALTGEIDLVQCQGEFVLVLSFGRHREEAGILARAALMTPFDAVLQEYVAGWNVIQRKCNELQAVDKEASQIFRMSTAVLKVHQNKMLRGSLIASLSIPWGFSKGDNDIGGYHLIWPRDQVHAAFAFMAAGDFTNALDALVHLMCTQEPDGHWIQCMWMDGIPYWSAIQNDQTALPILLADNLRRKDELEGLDILGMVERAAGFLARIGASSEQDRWEENEGFNPYTMAVTIAGLLAAADILDEAGKSSKAAYLRDTADCWNDAIDSLLYVKGTKLAQSCGVEGYYMRLLPKEALHEPDVKKHRIQIKNRLLEESYFHPHDIVSVDALALVRFGLRAADDPRIQDTVKVIDQLLKTETTKGPVWHRYNYDGYGEHADGSAFDGWGVGRGWPLLGGERGHYELAAGRNEEALRLLRVMAKQAGVGGLIPEQIWDAPDIPEKSLFNGHSSGSAKPLVWAHAEYLTLMRSIKEGKIYMMPPQTYQRYVVEKKTCPFVIWRLSHQILTIPAGKHLRIELLQSAVVRWSVDGWKTVRESQTVDSDFGVHYVDLPVSGDGAEFAEVVFTIFWQKDQKWENRDWALKSR